MTVKLRSITAPLFILLLAFIAGPVVAETDDEKAVKEAMMGYMNIFYNVDPDLADKVMWKDYRKLGYAKRDNGKYTPPMFMNMEQLKNLAANYNADGHIPADAPKKVTLFEVSDKTASGKVEAIWGFDYMHLAKLDGEWRIINIIWQTYP